MNINDNKKSFILYTEYGDIIETLSDEDAGILFKSIFSYCMNGKETELTGDARITFAFIKKDLDRNGEKYKDKCESSRINGLKGGRPKKIKEETPDENSETENLNNLKNPKNPTVFFKTLNDNDNDNENENDNENDNSLSLKREKMKEKEREILRNYVIKNRLADKNVEAYISRIIQNGDHKSILLSERKLRENSELPSKEDYGKIIAGIKDKRTAYAVLVKYAVNGNLSPPAEFCEIMKKYDFETYGKIEEYSNMLYKEKYGY